MRKVVFEDLDPSLLRNTQRIIVAACGTSYHASLIGKYMIEEVAGVNTQVELASSFDTEIRSLVPTPFLSRFLSRGRPRTPRKRF